MITALSSTEGITIPVFYSLCERLLDALDRAPWAIAACNIGAALLVMLLSYLIGSVNPAILLSKGIWKKDLYKVGFEVPDTYNMLQVNGKGAAALTLLCNLCKGALVAMMGLLLWGFNGRALATFFVMFGHAVPIFHRFSGGRGMGVLMGAIAVTSPLTAVILLAVFLVGAIGSRMVSFGAMLAVLLYPIILRAFYAVPDLTLAMSVFCAVFTLFAYRDSIKRIREGAEYKLDLGALFRRGGGAK